MHSLETLFDVIRVKGLAVGLARVPAAKHLFKLVPQIKLIFLGEFREKLERHTIVKLRFQEIAHGPVAPHHVVTHHLGESPRGRKLAQGIVLKRRDFLTVVRTKRVEWPGFRVKYLRQLGIEGCAIGG